MVVDVAKALLSELRGADRLEQAHPLGGVARGAAEVDELAAGAEGRGDLDDRDVVSAVSEHVGERESGDARAGDEYLHDFSPQQFRPCLAACVPTLSGGGCVDSTSV